MISPEIVDTVDVSDVCADFDHVTLQRDGHNYQATPFVDDEHGCREVVVDLTEYPAVVALSKRAFEVDRPVSYEPVEPIAATYGVGDDVE